MEFFYVKASTLTCSVSFILQVFLLFCSTEGSSGTISAVIAFGDSILDTGNNDNLNTMSKCNYPPYGKNFPGGIATGRFGNGKVFSDLLAEGLGVKELLPAYLSPNLQDADLPTGVCFASGGSGLDPTTSGIQGVLAATRQLELFKEYISRLQATVGKERSDAIISNALFLISFGNNDLAITYFSAHLRAQYDVPSYTSQLVTSASNFVKALYELGARRIAFMSTLPLGCLPSARALIGGQLCKDDINEAALMFNTKLSSELTVLGTTLSDAKILYLDVYHPLLGIIQNPQGSGFQVASVPCCCSGASSCPIPSLNVFWDYGHPSEKTYRIIVNQALQTYANFFS